VRRGSVNCEEGECELGGGGVGIVRRGSEIGKENWEEKLEGEDRFYHSLTFLNFHFPHFPFPVPSLFSPSLLSSLSLFPHSLPPSN